MPVLELEDSPEFVTIPEGEILEAVVVSVESYNPPNPDWGAKFRFKFVVTEDGPYRDLTVNGNTSQKFNTAPNCKLRVWVEELLASDTVLPVSFRLDTDGLVGLGCRIVIGNFTSENTDGTQSKRHFVSEVVRENTHYAAASSMSVGAGAYNSDADEPF